MRSGRGQRGSANRNAPGLALTGTVAAWSQTVPGASNYSELMTLSCKNALLAPGDEVQTLAAREGRARRPRRAHRPVRDRAARRRWSEVLTDAELI